jgi:flagellin
MTSLNTNNAATAALQTLRGIDSNLETTQNAVSSGLRVSKSADNAAYWSIATTMRSDNSAMSAVSDALGLGAAEVDTAYTAMSSSIDLVSQIKAKLVAASEDGVDKSKVQTEISQIQGQLKTIAQSASFSGENWLETDLSSPTDTVSKSVIGSFVRDPGGDVSVKTIDYSLDSSSVLFDTSGGDNGLLDKMATVGGGTNLVEVPIVKELPQTTTTQVDLTAAGATLSNPLVDLDAGFTMPIDALTEGPDTYMRLFDASGVPIQNGSGVELWTKVITLDTASTDPAVQQAVAAHPYVNFPTGDHGAVQGSGTDYYFYGDPATDTVQVAGMTEADIAGLPDATINGSTATIGSDTWIKADLSKDVWVKASPAASTTDDLAGVDVDGVNYDIDQSNTALPGGFLSAGLGFSVANLDLSKLSDVGSKLGITGSTSDQEQGALKFMIQYVDSTLQTMTDTAANLGSILTRIDLQSTFVSSLRDSITSGVGKLVDANMEQESSKLSAIQTQQQLAIQSLSIANHSSQIILSLFS